MKTEKRLSAHKVKHTKTKEKRWRTHFCPCPIISAFCSATPYLQCVLLSSLNFTPCLSLPWEWIQNKLIVVFSPHLFFVHWLHIDPVLQMYFSFSVFRILYSGSEYDGEKGTPTCTTSEAILELLTMSVLTFFGLLHKKEGVWSHESTDTSLQMNVWFCICVTFKRKILQWML